MLPVWSAVFACSVNMTRSLLGRKPEEKGCRPRHWSRSGGIPLTEEDRADRECLRGLRAETHAEQAGVKSMGFPGHFGTNGISMRLYRYRARKRTWFLIR